MIAAPDEQRPVPLPSGFAETCAAAFTNTVIGEDSATPGEDVRIEWKQSWRQAISSLNGLARCFLSGLLPIRSPDDHGASRTGARS